MVRHYWGSAMENTNVVAVIGLGYVGLPLAVEFGKRRTTVGFDLSAKKSSITATASIRPAK